MLKYKVGDDMKIISIKKSSKSKYKILLENDKSINIYDNVILNNNLLFKKEINEELLSKLEKENEEEDIYYKAINFISKKIRSKKEINEYLLKLDIPYSLKDKINERLASNLLINDEMYAKAYIHDKVYLSNDGPYKIKNDLVHNDIDDDTVNEVISKIDENIIYEKLTKLILKKINSNHNKSNYMLKQKIVGDMINLGYSKEMILEIIEENLKSNSNIVDNEYKKIYKKLEKKYEGDELEKQVINKLFQKGFSNEDINNIKSN